MEKPSKKKFEDRLESESWSEEVWLKKLEVDTIRLFQIPEKSRTLKVCLKALSESAKKDIYFSYIFEYIPKELYTNDLFHEKIIELLEHNGVLLQEIPEECITLAMCQIAYRGNGWIFPYIPKEFRKEKGKILSEEELKEKYTTEELLTSSNFYLRKLGILKAHIHD